MIHHIAKHYDFLKKSYFRLASCQDLCQRPQVLIISDVIYSNLILLLVGGKEFKG